MFTVPSLNASCNKSGCQFYHLGTEAPSGKYDCNTNRARKVVVHTQDVELFAPVTAAAKFTVKFTVRSINACNAIHSFSTFPAAIQIHSVRKFPSTGHKTLNPVPAKLTDPSSSLHSRQRYRSIQFGSPIDRPQDIEPSAPVPAKLTDPSSSLHSRQRYRSIQFGSPIDRPQDIEPSAPVPAKSIQLGSPIDRPQDIEPSAPVPAKLTDPSSSLHSRQRYRSIQFGSPIDRPQDIEPSAPVPAKLTDPSSSLHSRQRYRSIQFGSPIDRPQDIEPSAPVPAKLTDPSSSLHSRQRYRSIQFGSPIDRPQDIEPSAPVPAKLTDPSSSLHSRQRYRSIQFGSPIDRPQDIEPSAPVPAKLTDPSSSLHSRQRYRSIQFGSPIDRPQDIEPSAPVPAKLTDPSSSLHSRQRYRSIQLGSPIDRPQDIEPSAPVPAKLTDPSSSLHSRQRYRSIQFGSPIDRPQDIEPSAPVPANSLHSRQRYRSIQLGSPIDRPQDIEPSAPVPAKLTDPSSSLHSRQRYRSIQLGSPIDRPQDIEPSAPVPAKLTDPSSSLHSRQRYRSIQLGSPIDRPQDIEPSDPVPAKLTDPSSSLQSRQRYRSIHSLHSRQRYRSIQLGSPIDRPQDIEPSAPVPAKLTDPSSSLHSRQRYRSIQLGSPIDRPQDIEPSAGQVHRPIDATLTQPWVDISSYDDNFSDDEEYIPHSSDSEQEEDDEQEPHQDSTYFFGRDKMTKWKKEEWRTSRVRTRAINIISHLPCSKQFDENEIRCLLGLIIIIGKNRASHLHFKEIWNANGTGIEICRAAMAYERFLFLLRVIRFDNVLTRQIRRDNDKFAALREIFEMFVANCKQMYSPGEYLTIDEKLIPFRGKCNFRQYIPNKPAKYGLKIYMMSDAHTFYTVNMEPYVGNNRGPFYKSNASDDVVKRLVEPVSGTKRNITTDNWYTSFPLAQSLLTEHNLTLVGTLKKNKKEIPVEFLPNRNRPIFSSIFGFNENTTLVSYVPKKSKSVILLSTMHSTMTIDEDTGDKMKPEIVTFYNQTKIGVDVVDQMSGTYSVGRRTRRWPLCIFFDLVNVAEINAQVLYNANHLQEEPIKRRHFLEKIGLSLIDEHIKERLCIVSLPKDIKLALRRIIGVANEQTIEKYGITLDTKICSRTEKLKKNRTDGLDGSYEEIKRKTREVWRHWRPDLFKNRETE
ncbi:hypothetical protein LAZ67_8003857 [Cordylochernes scorpioides]|uniref:PiggyBac transposable element-derived protein domain-containing protein n=1 Tax=Cordylochernes scorpioides TaxID=51811 RepID=A0ABY6KSE7_9ARAC|nr:hypothetical protein LAZ67_8003857 [Cordylochernes scorpioides]